MSPLACFAGYSRPSEIQSKPSSLPFHHFVFIALSESDSFRGSLCAAVSLAEPGILQRNLSSYAA